MCFFLFIIFLTAKNNLNKNELRMFQSFYLGTRIHNTITEYEPTSIFSGDNSWLVVAPALTVIATPPSVLEKNKTTIARNH